MLRSYLKLCLFKSDPTTLMPTRNFSYNTIIFYMISGIIVEGLIADFADGTLEVSLRAIMAFSSVAIFLLIAEKNILLFQRVFTAIFVCENFIMTLAILCEVLDVVLIKMHYEYHEYVGVALAVFLVCWYLGIVAYILRRFFKYEVGKSLTLAFSYFILTYGIPMLFMDI
jgi:hypothetical protein